MKISFCTITLNEEENLPRALKSCADLADEIVIVDSGSVDGTEGVAREFGARWKHQDWLGYRDQKQLSVDLASSEWAFVLDADEELSEPLREELRALKNRGPEADVAGWSVPRCTFYEGRWIRHGDWYPDRILRLVRRSKARFEGGRVHERLEVDGRVLELRNDLNHYSFKDAADHWKRCEKYARLWAETQHENGRKAGPLAPMSRAAFRWLRGYLFKGGFLDGAQGARIARMNAREVKLKYELLRELNRAAK